MLTKDKKLYKYKSYRDIGNLTLFATSGFRESEVFPLPYKGSWYNEIEAVIEEVGMVEIIITLVLVIGLNVLMCSMYCCDSSDNKN